MITRLGILLNVTSDIETYYEPAGRDIWHWERMKISLYGYDLWAYSQVWKRHLPDLWITPIGSWEFVKLSLDTKNYRSVYYCRNVRKGTRVDLLDHGEEEMVHAGMLRTLL